MSESTWDAFQRIDIRAGTVREVRPFPEARKPAWQLVIDFGPEIGLRQSSAQLTVRYQPADLLGRQVLAVVNFPPRQIGPFRSEVLVLGLDDGAGGIALVVPDGPVPDGHRLH